MYINFPDFRNIILCFEYIDLTLIHKHRKRKVSVLNYHDVIVYVIPYRKDRCHG